MFIVIEGPDGVGKSTLCQTLPPYLTSDPDRVKVLWAPGGSPTANRLRELLLHNTWSKDAEIHMFLSTLHELTETITTHIQQGGIIVCDRYLRSTYVYQLLYRTRTDPTFCREFWDQVFLNLHLSSLLVPDIELVLMTDPETAHRRVHQRDVHQTRFEDQSRQEITFEGYHHDLTYMPIFKIPPMMIQVADHHTPEILADIVAQTIHKTMRSKDL